MLFRSGTLRIERSQHKLVTGRAQIAKPFCEAVQIARAIPSDFPANRIRPFWEQKFDQMLMGLVEVGFNYVGVALHVLKFTADHAWAYKRRQALGVYYSLSCPGIYRSFHVSSQSHPCSSGLPKKNHPYMDYGGTFVIFRAPPHTTSQDARTFLPYSYFSLSLSNSPITIGRVSRIKLFKVSDFSLYKNISMKKFHAHCPEFGCLVVVIVCSDCLDAITTMQDGGNSHGVSTAVFDDCY